jgi:hypothetical protein
LGLNGGFVLPVVFKHGIKGKRLSCDSENLVPFLVAISTCWQVLTYRLVPVPHRLGDKHLSTKAEVMVV